MDEHIQADAPEDCYTHPVNIRATRGSKGNRKAQSARYYQRNKAKRRDYMRRYMRAKRAGLRG